MLALMTVFMHVHRDWSICLGGHAYIQNSLELAVSFALTVYFLHLEEYFYTWHSLDVQKEQDEV